MCKFLNRLENLRFEVGDIVGFVGGCGLPGVADGRGRIGLRVGFIRFTGFLVKGRACGEASDRVGEALGWWGAQSAGGGVSGASKVTIKWLQLTHYDMRNQLTLKREL